MTLKEGYTRGRGQCRRQDDGNYSILNILLDAADATDASACAGLCERDVRCVAFDF